MSDLYQALASAIYVSRQTLAGNAIETDDQRIRASGLYDDWVEGAHKRGEIYNAAGQTWECYQDYDNAVYPDIKPGEAAWYTFNRPLHGTTAETARPFVAPTHSQDIYRAGEYMIWIDGTVQKCLLDTAYSPADYAPAWEEQA